MDKLSKSNDYVKEFEGRMVKQVSVRGNTENDTSSYMSIHFTDNSSLVIKVIEGGNSLYLHKSEPQKEYMSFTDMVYEFFGWDY